MKRELRIKIDEAIDEKIPIVKQHYGLKNDSELVRFLIVKTYNEIVVYKQLPNNYGKPREPQEVDFPV